MEISITTRWNASRHRDGRAMIEEILRLGFNSVELGYDLTAELEPGVVRMVSEKAVRVVSLHNFCPLPIGAPTAHPEIFSLSSCDPMERKSAVRHTARTIDFANQVGATVVVAHAGNVDMRIFTPKLIRLAEQGQLFSHKYDLLKMKLIEQREAKARVHLNNLRRSIEELLPMLSNFRVTLALESLPFWESLPTEVEMSNLTDSIDSPFLGWWLDVGHEKIRENLGFISMERWIKRLHSRLAGIHIHDVRGVANDHVMPPNGTLNFAMLRPHIDECLPLVIEPVPFAPEAEIIEARRFLIETWDSSNTTEFSSQQGKGDAI